jgi:hypothetical protein
MTGAYDERDIISCSTAFQSFFGNPMANSKTFFSPDSAVVDIDIRRGNQKLACMIQRGTQARPISLQNKATDTKFSTEGRLYPLIEEVSPLAANQLLTRILGEIPYQNMSGLTKFDRARVYAMDYHKEHLRRIVRRNEYLAAQSMLTGTMPALSGDNVTDDWTYHFHRKSTHNFTTNPLWSGTTPDMLGDLDAACELIRVDGRVTPDMCVMGGYAMELFLYNETIWRTAHNRRYEMIYVNDQLPLPPAYDRFVKAGMICRGKLRTPKGYELWLFTYVDTYQDDAGVAHKYMPDNQVMVTKSDARFDRYFGPSDTFPMTAQRAQWFAEIMGFSPLAIQVPANIKDVGFALPQGAVYCDAYPSVDEKTITIRTQCAPIFATTMTDTISVMTISA